MKGREMGACAGCGLRKGDRDPNAGWWEMGPRGHTGYHLALLFCPPCGAALLVGLDEKMAEGRKNPNLVALLKGDLERILRVMQEASTAGLGVALQNEHSHAVELLARLTRRKPWHRREGES